MVSGLLTSRPLCLAFRPQPVPSCTKQRTCPYPQRTPATELHRPQPVPSCTKQGTCPHPRKALRRQNYTILLRAKFDRINEFTKLLMGAYLAVFLRLHVCEECDEHVDRSVVGGPTDATEKRSKERNRRNSSTGSDMTKSGRPERDQRGSESEREKERDRAEREMMGATASVSRSVGRRRPDRRG